MRYVRVGVLAAVLAMAAATPAAGAPSTTVERTVQDCDGDNLLEPALGEGHRMLVPARAASPAAGEASCRRPEDRGSSLRLPPSASIVNVLHLSDFQIVDEESPARVEFLDGTQRIPRLQPFSAAYRPQESLTTQVTEAMVRQARNTVSPITAAPLDLAILTGDNADSQGYNETRWFIDVLDGTDSAENPDPEMDPRPNTPERKVDPDSGIPVLGCEATPGSRYDGVRDSGRSGVSDGGYYEPDSSTGARDDGDGYSPLRGDNVAETGRDVTVRDFPGLLERANEPFEAIGLDLPWYSAFGNHDALVQGNSPDAYVGPFGPGRLAGDAPEEHDPAMHDLATGCVKVLQPSAAIVEEAIEPRLAEIVRLREDGVTAEEQEAIDRLTGEVLAVSTDALLEPCDPDADEGCVVEVVPPDERRCFLAKDEPDPAAPGPCRTAGWIGQHFRTTGTPVGHGFAPSPPAPQGCADDPAAPECVPSSYGRPPEAQRNDDGYYAFSPRPGLRFVVLDTVTDECGSQFCAEGSVDDPQFDWLERQLGIAAVAGEYVLVFSHHTLRTIRFPTADASEQPAHFGQRVDRRASSPQNPSGARTLEDLYCERPNVLAHVAGHEHENYVERHDCADDRPPAACSPCANPHFWQVSTAAHIDWPQQARMIELVNLGGHMAIVSTILDHDGPANAGGAPEQADQGRAPDDVVRLAAIAREVAYNDYQADRGARGGPQDRNVVLPTDRPPPPYAAPPW